MLSNNREFNFVGELNLSKSRVLNAPTQPQNDKVNWLFLNIGERQFSFVYKIENPIEANYEKPFKAYLAFTMIETVKDIIQLNHKYEVMRGQEAIGTVKLINALG